METKKESHSSNYDILFNDKIKLYSPKLGVAVNSESIARFDNFILKNSP